MELRTTREMRRNEQLSKTTAKKADTSAKPQAQPALKRQSADKVSVSRQALAFFEEQNRLRQAEEQRRAAQNQDGSSQLDLLEKGLDVLDKCQKIAASIMKGNRVPPEDLEYLMNNDPDGYKLAMAMRRENPDPEDEESVLTDEDKNGSAQRSGGSEERPSAGSAEGSSGGEASGAEP